MQIFIQKNAYGKVKMFCRRLVGWITQLLPLQEPLQPHFPQLP